MHEKKYIHCRLAVDDNIHTPDSIKIYQSTFYKGYSARLFCSHYYTHYPALESPPLFT